MKKIKLYSDGACSGNPGPGGYGAILTYKTVNKQLSRGYRRTTNNRMELLGVIEPLESLKEICEVHIVTDSQYVANAINQEWIKNWVKNGWKTAGKKPVKNQDLWKRFISLIEEHDLTIEWVKGHDGHTENEICDSLAVKAISGKLVEDKGYNG